MKKGDKEGAEKLLEQYPLKDYWNILRAAHTVSPVAGEIDRLFESLSSIPSFSQMYQLDFNFTHYHGANEKFSTFLERIRDKRPMTPEVKEILNEEIKELKAREEKAAQENK